MDALVPMVDAVYETARKAVHDEISAGTLGERCSVPTCCSVKSKSPTWRANGALLYFEVQR